MTVQDLLDRLGTFGLEVAGRLLTVALVIATLLVVYAVVAWAIRRVAARASLAPLPGDDDLPDPDRALRIATRQRRLDTLVLFVTRLARGAVVVLGGLSAVAILVPELLTALGSLGVALGAAVGAALGFGAQQLVRDYLNGILILSENPFSVGDVVAVAGVTGTIEEIGLRRTVLRDVDGTVHSVPNGEILVASNFTRTTPASGSASSWRPGPTSPGRPPSSAKPATRWPPRTGGASASSSGRGFSASTQPPPVSRGSRSS